MSRKWRGDWLCYPGWWLAFVKMDTWSFIHLKKLVAPGFPMRFLFPSSFRTFRKDQWSYGLLSRLNSCTGILSGSIEHDNPSAFVAAHCREKLATHSGDSLPSEGEVWPPFVRLPLKVGGFGPLHHETSWPVEFCRWMSRLAAATYPRERPQSTSCNGSVLDTGPWTPAVSDLTNNFKVRVNHKTS